MAAVKIMPVSKETYLERIKELEGLISDREQQLVKLNNMQSVEIEELKKERDSLLGQVKSFDKWRQDLLNKTQQEIKEKEQEHQKSKAIVTGIRQSREIELTREIERLNTTLKERNNELKDKEQRISETEQKLKEQETLLVSRTEEIERLKSIENKLDYVIEMNETILETVKKNDIKLIETISKEDVTVDEIKKTVESNKKRLDKNVSNKKRIQEENEYIIKGLREGKLQKQIADELWPDISSRQTKMTERIKNYKLKEMI